MPLEPVTREKGDALECARLLEEMRRTALLGKSCRDRTVARAEPAASTAVREHHQAGGAVGHDEITIEAHAELRLDGHDLVDEHGVIPSTRRATVPAGRRPRHRSSDRSARTTARRP